MLVNDTSSLTQKTIDKLNKMGFIHINTGRKPLTEETAIELIEQFSNIFPEDDKGEC